jgi:ribosomal protein L37E
MAFKRQGTPEEFQPVMFKCPQCGKDAITLINGICELCGLNKNPEIKKISKHKKHKKS